MREMEAGGCDGDGIGVVRTSDIEYSSRVE